MAASNLLRILRRLRRSLWMPMLLGFIGAALPAHAVNNCPWMSEATASSLLGGDAAVVYVAATERKPAVCTFTQQTAQGVRSLQLTVQVVGDPQARLAQAESTCGTDPAPLHAIGNEAIFCTGEDGQGQRSEHAVGRVRDQLFSILIGTSVKDDAVLTRDALKARIYTASEQVTGNLF
jgi:hypothetical protein